MKIMLIHYGSADNPRATKICQSLMNVGHTVIFVGWERNPGQPKRLSVPASQYLIMNRPALSGAPSLKSLWYFSIHIIKALYIYRPDVVHCVNEEMAALVLPFRRVLFRRLVCDVFDGLADRIPFSRRLLRVILLFVRAVVYTGSDQIVMTDERRYNRLAKFKSKAIVVENTPVDPGPDLALCFPEGETKVLFSGNITRTRGCDVAKGALDRARGVKILAAGFLDEFAEQTLIQHPQVTYLGVLTPRESLDVMARCDAVLALYEPTSVNNIFASPSKVFDAMSVGRPIIVNAETKVSKWILEHRLGFEVPYYDVEALAHLFTSLREFRAQLPEFAFRARKLFLNEHSWRSMEERLLQMYAQV